MNETPVFRHVRRTDAPLHQVGTGLALAAGALGIGVMVSSGGNVPSAALGTVAIIGCLLLPVGLYGLYRVLRPVTYASELSPDGLLCTRNGQEIHRVSRADIDTFVYKHFRTTELVDIYLKAGGSERISPWYFDTSRLREQLIALDYPVVWEPGDWTETELRIPDAARGRAK